MAKIDLGKIASNLTFAPGTVVMYKASFLRSIGAYTKDIADRKGIVVEGKVLSDNYVCVLWNDESEVHMWRKAALIPKNKLHLDHA